ncbi:MAG: acetylxylan esterase [Myxococcota bacterium]|jgi:dienelactone hydrolase|nr:acetylxylan esterase [Myxococcota bacterium]
MIEASAESPALWMRDVRPPAAAPALRATAFEYSSRGDRVPGMLLLPADGAGPFPLALVQHGAGGSKDAAYLDAVRLRWVERGIAVASIDFPLHGERASAKLTEQLLAMLGPGTRPSADAVALFGEFARQSIADLARAVDVLGSLPEIDAERVAYVGFSLGAILGSLYVPYDPRVRAAVLAVGGAGIGPASIDPTAHIGRFAPRPLLLVNASRDERIPRRAAEALHAAAGDPKEIEWFDAGHTDLPGAALKRMWSFLATHLRVA